MLLRKGICVPHLIEQVTGVYRTLRGFVAHIVTCKLHTNKQQQFSDTTTSDRCNRELVVHCHVEITAKRTSVGKRRMQVCWLFRRRSPRAVRRASETTRSVRHSLLSAVEMLASAGHVLLVGVTSTVSKGTTTLRIMWAAAERFVSYSRRCMTTTTSPAVVVWMGTSICLCSDRLRGVGQGRISAKGANTITCVVYMRSSDQDQR